MSLLRLILGAAYPQIARRDAGRLATPSTRGIDLAHVPHPRSWHDVPAARFPARPMIHEGCKTMSGATRFEAN